MDECDENHADDDVDEDEVWPVVMMIMFTVKVLMLLRTMLMLMMGLVGVGS